MSCLKKKRIGDFKKTAVEFANRTDPDDETHCEQRHLGYHCLPSSL